MVSTPGVVILPSDVANTGKNVDNTIVTNEASQSVYRQSVNLADPVSGTQRQTVNANGGAAVTVIPLSQTQLTPIVINTSASGNISLGAAAAGLKNKMYRLLLFIEGTTNLTFLDGTTPLSGPLPFLTGQPIILDYSGDPWYQSSAGNALNLNSSANVGIFGTAWCMQS